MTQIQSFHLFNYSSKRRLLLATLFLFVIGGMAALTAPRAWAAESATCSIRSNGEFAYVGDGEFEECADFIIENAELVNGLYHVGQWSEYTIAIDQNRNAWYRAEGRRNFRNYGIIPEIVADEQTPADPNDPDGDGIVGEADACPAEAEVINGVFDTDGCPDTIEDLLTFAENDLNQWWDGLFTESNLTYYPPRRVVPYREAPNQRLENNAFYTSGGHYIGYDLDLMERSLNRHGDFAPVAILAHEWGHLVQANLGIRQEYTILQELQADCLAGAYGTYLEERGNLEEGDLEEGLRQMFAIGDSPNVPWFHSSAHGTGEQRYEAFQHGFDHGVESCIETYTG